MYMDSDNENVNKLRYYICPKVAVLKKLTLTRFLIVIQISDQIATILNICNTMMVIQEEW